MDLIRVKRSGSTSKKLKKQPPESGKPTNDASSGRSSHDSGRRTHLTEPGAGESAKRDVHLTSLVSPNEARAIHHEDKDVEMQPPSSQSTTSSLARHQAQSVTTAPPVPPKQRVDIASGVDTNSQRRENQENERSRREQQHKERSAKRDIPLTGPISPNEAKSIHHEDEDVEMQPPSSQSTTSSPARHQARSATSAPPVPHKPRVNIVSEVDTNSQRRENQENERSGREQQRQPHEERKFRNEREAKERENEEWREQQTNEHHAREEELMRERERETREREREEQRRNAVIEKKKRDLQELKTQVAEANTHYEELARENQQLKEESNRLNSEWTQNHHLLETQRQVLNASRSFAAREGTLDAATLIQSFNDLNSSIGDFSFEVLRGLDENADTHPLAESDYGRLHETLTDPNLKFFVEQISHRDLKASDLVDPIVTGIIAADLMSAIFKPFVPGLDEDRSNVLKRMYRKMQESEPQERSARWRSITYSHAIPNPEPDFLHQKANGSVSKVMDVLTALSGGSKPKPTKEYYELAHRIFEAAVKVQDRAKKEYVSFDYEVYSVRAKTKYDKTMDVSQAGNDDPSQVWITIGLGMRASRSIQGEGNLLNPERSIPVKPMVICDNWDHNA